MKTKIFTAILIPIVVFMTYYLIYSVKGPLDKIQQIEETEAAIKQKLRFIRDLEIAYQSQNGVYTGKFDKLIDFAKNGSYLIVQQKEITKLKANGQEEVKIVLDTLGSVPVRDSLFKKYPNINIDKLDVAPGSGKKFTLYAGQIENGNIKVNVFEVKDEYPINEARGGVLNEKGEPYSVTSLIKHFKSKLKKKRDEAVLVQRKMKGANDATKKELQGQIDELSKYINLYEKRIEQLEDKPLKVGSRTEATTSGNWE